MQESTKGVVNIWDLKKKLGGSPRELIKSKLTGFWKLYQINNRNLRYESLNKEARVGDIKTWGNCEYRKEDKRWTQDMI